MKRVLIIQRILPHYRVPLFRELRAALLEKGVLLDVVYGQEAPGSVPRSVDLDVPWAVKVRNQYLPGGLVWQPALRMSSGRDLVIVEQANRLALNYVLLARRALGGCRIAYFGHGKNFQAGPRVGTMEWLKEWLSRSVDWWFVYSQVSADVVQASGFPAVRITDICNTIDSRGLQADLDAVSAADVVAERRRLGLVSERVGLYCGGMYPNKRLRFLVEACRRIREQDGTFEMIFVGDGPDQSIVEAACSRYPWMHYVGAVYGRDKAVYLKIASMMLMPGSVGLVIIDCFVAGLPIVTTDNGAHGPEIAYLEHGRNGLITADGTAAYVDSVLQLLNNEGWRRRLVTGCEASAKVYTIDNMVQRFSQGVVQALEHLAAELGR